ncbi:MAG: M90 family metallopeptidase [Wenzhouxiangella sp.]
MKGLFGKRRSTVDIAPDALRRVLDRFPALAAESSSALAETASELLASKTFLGADGFEPDLDDCLAVALLAAQPIVQLGTHWYRGFQTFILYPGEFVADLQEMDEFGLVHEGEEVRAGEAWAHGPVVLAMDEVWASGQGEGYNVVAHELAHQIDQANGDMDGFPPLHRDMDRARWTDVFSQAWQRLNAQLDQDQEPDLDPYAAESPAEFFAVVTELYFDVPDWLAEVHPALHQQLERFYRPDISPR